MKTFTATQLNKSPQEIFAAAKEDGAIIIKHDRYSGFLFRLCIEDEYSPAIVSIAKEMGEAFDGGAYITDYDNNGK